ncbi:MAG: PorP/SprF family type IX secretion system membrane protein [Muribaculaceae bacterium]|nr:PorP/SprF family type IX secretion system membrane protein [Muribaculaceae bacterium]
MTTLKASNRILALSLAVVLWLAAGKASAQTDAQLSQYWAVPAYYNPGAIGQTDFIHITAGGRLQWVGIKHAPYTFMALADMPFKFFERRWGVGVRLQQESMGLYKSVQAGAQLAWKKKMLGGTLSVGLQPGMINQTFGGQIIIPEDNEYHQGSSSDDAIPDGTVSGTSFDASGGVMFTHRHWWVGASVTHITAPTVVMKQGESEDKQYEFNTDRTYYFTAGGNIPIKNTLFEVMPSMLFKTDLTFWQAEATARLRYNKFLSAAVGYRYQDAISVQIGAELKNFFIGYNYDWPLSDIRVSGGSHELFVSYNVKLDMGEKNRNSHKSIRIM